MGLEPGAPIAPNTLQLYWHAQIKTRQKIGLIRRFCPMRKRGSCLNAPTWQDLILLPPFLIFGIAEELGSGPGEAVVGQPGVFLSDEQGPKEAFGSLLIILNCDLEKSYKVLVLFFFTKKLI